MWRFQTIPLPISNPTLVHNSHSKMNCCRRASDLTSAIDPYRDLHTRALALSKVQIIMCPGDNQMMFLVPAFCL